MHHLHNPAGKYAAYSEVSLWRRKRLLSKLASLCQVAQVPSLGEASFQASVWGESLVVPDLGPMSSPIRNTRTEADLRVKHLRPPAGSTVLPEQLRPSRACVAV